MSVLSIPNIPMASIPPEKSAAQAKLDLRSVSEVAEQCCLADTNVKTQTEALLILQDSIREGQKTGLSKAELTEAQKLEVKLLRAILNVDEELESALATAAAPIDPKAKIERKIKKLISLGMKTTQLIFSGRAVGRFVFWKDDCWEIDEKTLTQGGYKTVKKLRNVVTGIPALGKRARLSDKSDAEEAAAEKTSGESLQGIANVIPMYCNESYKSESRGDSQFSVEYFAEDGSLDDLTLPQWEKLTPILKMTIILDVCRGVKDMHARGFVHRDLQMGNIVLSQKDGKAYLIDFGRSKPASPELIDRDREATGQRILDIVYLSEFPKTIKTRLCDVCNAMRSNEITVKDAYDKLEEIDKDFRARKVKMSKRRVL